MMRFCFIVIIKEVGTAAELKKKQINLKKKSYLREEECEQKKKKKKKKKKKMQILSSGITTLQIPSSPSLRNTHSTNNNNGECCFSTLCLSVSGNPSNKKKLKFTVKCRSSEYFEQPPQQQQKVPSKLPNQTLSSQALGTSPPRVFAGHSIYKGKAALTVDPISPEFTSLSSGAFKVTREGFLLLQFAPAIGVRQYDWERKQVFSLSVAEIGALVCLGPKDSLEFYHDPFKGRSDEGKVKKVLKVEPFPDGSGHFFILDVQNKLLNVDEKINIPVTKAELAVLKSAFNYILPYLLGWHTFVNSIKPADRNRVNTTAPSRGYGSEVDYEWSR